MIVRKQAWSDEELKRLAEDRRRWRIARPRCGRVETENCRLPVSGA